MIAIEDIQSTVAGLIRSHSYLDGLPVYEDAGRTKPLVEDALGDDGGGVAIVVSYPTEGSPTDGGNNLGVEDVGVTVSIRVNDLRNDSQSGYPAGFQKNLVLILKSVKEAVVSWPTPNNDRLGFRLAGWQFAWEVPGESGYHVFFNVRAASQKP